MGIGQATSANVRQHQPRPARIGRGLRTSLSRRRAWPGRIALGLHTAVSRRRPWPGRIALGLHTTVSRRRPWTARIGRGLRNIGRGLVDNMWMSMHSQNQKSGIMHNNIFIYFPSSILNVSASRGSFVPIFIIFTVYYFLHNIL